MKSESTFRLDVTEPFQHLAAAPIVEAAIHWVARSGVSFPSDALGKQLADRLPEYPACHRQHKLEVESQFDPDGSSTQTRRDTWLGFRLTSSDKLQIAQFTRDGVVFSRLAPYQNWDLFSTEAMRMWKVFVELAAPSEVQRLGVRFINRIMPVELAGVGRYLSSPPKCLEPLEMPMRTFLYQSQHDVPEHPFCINVTQTVQPPVPAHLDEYGLIVDIDVFTTQAFTPSDEILLDYLAKMRCLKNRAFFKLMSKKAIKLFEGTTNG